ncbi:stability/partitioning determinant [Methylobacterium durans]|uniref:stability/partitioning determinant n=1 Tax=Methylobacterium durans TaxID=2202825 RepID=UPI002AFFCD04|nr:stability/partitioning determinant [Methylobacterium durans]MEA1835186.1 stability/partitioning determinant [Methylobacterium durans]
MSTTMKDRPSLGFGDELDDFDPAAWTKPESPGPKLAPEETRQAAEAAGFRSREPGRAEASAALAPQQRRRRTGRNVQFNIKTRAETIKAFTRIADANGWGLGETFERATELLARENATR